MSKRRSSRAAAYQVLYAMDMGGTDPHRATVLHGAMEGDEDVRPVDEFAAELVAAYEAHREGVDAVISAASTRWSLDRMGAPDRALLRLGTTELLHFPDIPHGVIINEYIELAKRYGDSESPRFVNGLLDKVRREHRG
jgi:N utilization substance protein B